MSRLSVNDMCLSEGYVEATTKGAQVIVNEVRFALNINVLKYDCTNIVIYIINILFTKLHMHKIEE